MFEGAGQYESNRGKPALPVGHECLSTGFMRDIGTRLLDILYVMKRLNMRSSGGATFLGGKTCRLK